MLVDTHVAIWWVLGGESLGARCRDQMRSGQPVWVSAISLAEMIIKSMNGRWDLPDDVPAELADHGFRVLSVNGAHSIALRTFPELKGHDPFDRMLVAQAKVERLDFLTADRHLLSLGYDWIVDARV